jgi:hypothetical protein
VTIFDQSLTMSMLHSLKTAWGRLIAGLTVVLTLCWLNGARFTGVVDWEPTVAFILAALAWLYGCFPDQEPSVRPSEAHDAAAPSSLSAHDTSLYARFTQEFDNNVQLVLRRQDFAAAFDTADLDKVREISATWRGPNYEFDDPELSPQFAELLQKLRTFSSAVALGTQMQGATNFAKMLWDHEDDAGSMARQKALNDAADDLVRSADIFIRAGRRRLPG